MFLTPVKDRKQAVIILPGLMLGEYEPSPAEEEAVRLEMSRWKLYKLRVEESPHLCYNHLTDYTFREELPVTRPIAEGGCFCGAVFEAEDVSNYCGRLVSKREPGAVMTDGSRYGKTREYYMNSTASCGSSGESEYALSYEADPRGDILVTAFMPFGGETVNPTEQALSLLPDGICGFRIKKLLLPVEFGRAAELAAGEYDRLSPAAVVMLGQAGGRSAITPELAAKNLMDARIPDNAGFMPKGLKIAVDGEETLASTLPNEEIVKAIRALGLHAELSRDAGAYVCNSLLYSMLLHTGGRIPAGFIHIPFSSEQTEGVPGRENTPNMRLDDMEKAIAAAIAVVAGTIQ